MPTTRATRDVRKKTVRINHGSVHATQPERAARNLAALTGGSVQPFHPYEGAWVCFLNSEDWAGELIEFYPRTVALATEAGKLVFRTLARPAPSGGTHFNLSVPKKRAELEAICSEQGVHHAWRDWQDLLEVWLEDDLLIEVIPS